MTPRDVDGEAVETCPACDSTELRCIDGWYRVCCACCIETVRCSDSTMAVSLWNDHIRGLKSRPKVSVEEAERVWHIAQAACGDVDSKHPGRPKLLAGLRAVLALCEGKT